MMRIQKEEQALRRRTVGQFLKDGRERAGLTQRALADRLSYSSPQFVSNWERGESLPPMHVLLEIPALLAISPRRLLEIVAEYQKEVLVLHRNRWQRMFAQKLAELD